MPSHRHNGGRLPPAHDRPITTAERAAMLAIVEAALACLIEPAHLHACARARLVESLERGAVALAPRAPRPGRAGRTRR